MADKDLLGIIADMLRKLDQHSETLNKHAEALNKHAETLELQNEALRKQTEVLSAFADGTVKQFDQQMIINEKIIDQLDNLESRFNRN